MSQLFKFSDDMYKILSCRKEAKLKLPYRRKCGHEELEKTPSPFAAAAVYATSEKVGLMGRVVKMKSLKSH